MGTLHIRLKEGATGSTEIPTGMFFDQDDAISIILDQGVTGISNNSFSQNDKVTDVYIYNSNCYFELDGYQFQGCSKLTSVKLPDNLGIIPEYAFADTCLMDLVLPKNLIRINKRAFAGCNYLGMVTFPDTITHMSEDAFEDYGSFFVMRVYPNSYALNYAQKYNIPYVIIGEDWKTITNTDLIYQVKNKTLEIKLGV